MIKVHPTVYRVVWITCAVFSAILAVGPLMLLSEDVHPHDPEEFRATTIGFGVIGAIALAYSLWRLIRPLKAPPRE